MTISPASSPPPAVLPSRPRSLCARAQALFSLRPDQAQLDLPHLYGAAKVLVRLHNHPGSFKPISSILADQIGRLVTIRGTVTRATPARPLVMEMQFVCGKCGEPQVGRAFRSVLYAIYAACT
jgi:DNA replicative helicase MCM subunit Mcm2 (Cdc46/Mcm family)